MIDIILKKLKVTKTQLALKVGVSLVTLRSWQLGLSKPSPKNQEKLQSLLDEK